jgi:hypothetical protein
MRIGYAHVSRQHQSLDRQIGALRAERERITSRAHDGRAAVRRRGVHMDRKPKLTNYQQSRVHHATASRLRGA